MVVSDTINLKSCPPRDPRNDRLHGIVASPGIAIGRALVLAERLKVPTYEIKEGDVKAELIKFDGSLAASRDQLIELKNRNWESKQTLQIIDSQLMILKDPLFVGEVIQKVREDRRNIESVVLDVVEEFSSSFEKMQDTYMKDRAFDIRDVGARILRVLMGKDFPDLDQLEEDTILVCKSLSPSEIAHLDRQRVLGLVSETGGVTSHAAILARSLNICAIIGIENVTSLIRTGDTVILDAVDGIVHIDPDRALVRDYQERRRQRRLDNQIFTRDVTGDCQTDDNVPLILRANIGSAQEVATLQDFGARGVGLFRTEYLYLNAPSLPTEDEQYEAYRRVAQVTQKDAAIFRTLDLGGDKSIPLLGPSESKSIVGWRSIRFCLDHPHIFQPQLRAILRASAHGNVKIMFPMISGVDEFLQARECVEQAKEEILAQGGAFDPDISIGVMIELPSAALIADLLAKEADFFSIGTNDLIQFTMGVDRTSDRFGGNFEYLSLAVIRLIRFVVDAATQENIPVSCCGEVSATPAGFVLLTGLGIREFSMNSFAIPQFRKLASRMRTDRATDLAGQALKCSSSGQVKDIFCNYVREIQDPDTPLSTGDAGS